MPAKTGFGFSFACLIIIYYIAKSGVIILKQNYLKDIFLIRQKAKKLTQNKKCHPERKRRI